MPSHHLTISPNRVPGDLFVGSIGLGGSGGCTVGCFGLFKKLMALSNNLSLLNGDFFLWILRVDSWSRFFSYQFVFLLMDSWSRFFSYQFVFLLMDYWSRFFSYQFVFLLMDSWSRFFSYQLVFLQIVGRVPRCHIIVQKL